LFSASLIDGINQNEARRRALVIFCAAYLNENVKDALVLSIDRKGLSLLGKVLGPMMDDGSHEYQWKELRLLFSEEARDVETFCKRLVEMEKDTLKNISGFSGRPLNENQI
ncbi:L-ectoine synthase, partial [Tanacetum coccineum]